MSSKKPPFFVRDNATLERFCAEWLPRIDGRRIALDIEEDRMKHYYPSVALIQVSITENDETLDALIDPLAFDADTLKPCLEHICFASAGVVMHGARNDVVGLKRDYGFAPANLLDTQIAARFLGMRSFGLAALLKEFFGIKLSKAAQRSDWLQRPLTDAQIEYARLDTHHLEALFSNLENELQSSGWQDAFTEECRVMATLPAEEITFDPWGWTRIKQVRKLDDDGKRKASAIWAWREDYGRETNTHPNEVLPSWAIAVLAERGSSALRSGSVASLLKRVPKDAIHDLKEAMKNSDDHSVRKPRRKGQRDQHAVPTDVVKTRYSALREWREQASRDHNLDRGWLAPNAELEQIAQTTELTLDELADIEAVRDWQLERFGEQWLDILRANSE